MTLNTLNDTELLAEQEPIQTKGTEAHVSRTACFPR